MQIMLRNILLCSLLFTSLIFCIEYENQIQLEHSEGNPADYFLYWNIVEDVIQIKITAKTLGWIGFGLSPEGTMVNSDVVIGWISDSGDSFFDDRFAVQYSEPIRDVDMSPAGEDNTNLLSIGTSDGWTTIEYSRLLNTHDEWDVPISAGETTIVWAMGYEGDNPQSGQITRHQYRAVNTVTFFDSSFSLPEILPPRCSGETSRKFYTGDSSSVVGLRLESLAGDIKLSDGALSEITVNVLESGYTSSMLSSVQTNFYSPNQGLWAVTSQRGDSSLSTPNTSNGPQSGATNPLNTTIGNNECVGSDMNAIIPKDNSFTHVSAFTHEGHIKLNQMNVNSKLQVKTNGGTITGEITVNYDTSLSILSEWSEVALEVERSIDFDGSESLRVLLIGFAGEYNIETSSGNSLIVTGDMVTPTSGSENSEQGYVGFAGLITSINITATCDIEVAFFHDADTLTVDLQMPNYNVPSKRTSYICTPVDFPRDQDYHIVRIDPIKDQQAVLHHMVLFICPNQQEASEPWDCSDMDPDCQEMLYVWAVGGENFFLPAEAGFPMGPNGSQFALLQIHYDNPDNLDNIWDTSGFRLYYTPNLRKYDAGILQIGSMNIAIPPGEEAYTVGTQEEGCPAECSTQNIPEDTELIVFASMLHAHLAGRQIYTEHYRQSGNETIKIDDLNNNPYYDFNVQAYDLFNPPKTMQPGDSLVTYCVYNTEDRTDTTYFGLSTYEEMCFNYVAYYPLAPWAYCYGSSEHLAYCDDATFVNSWE